MLKFLACDPAAQQTDAMAISKEVTVSNESVTDLLFWKVPAGFPVMAVPPCVCPAVKPDVRSDVDLGLSWAFPISVPQNSVHPVKGLLPTDSSTRVFTTWWFLH